mmetsp:Transcript_35064/g.78045  ORF Transcript_35064/g.78045 Transcript_35064/m.78045 type:complete len:355 (+) Transcript_35064:152-1216(+)
MLTGIAKPTPLLMPLPVGSAIAVLIPITRPALSRRMPPELPGLIAASVWITFLMRASPVSSSLPSPLMMPWVSVWSRPKGLPMAYTFCPTRRPSEMPSVTGLSSPMRPSSSPVSCSTAMSLSASNPTTLALYVLWSSSVTLTSAAPLITWKLVTTWPLSSQMKPEPRPAGSFSTSSDRYPVCTARMFVMLTTLGVFCWKMRMLACSSGDRPSLSRAAGAGLCIVRLGAGATTAAGSAYAGMAGVNAPATTLSVKAAAAPRLRAALCTEAVGPSSTSFAWLPACLIRPDARAWMVAALNEARAGLWPLQKCTAFRCKHGLGVQGDVACIIGIDESGRTWPVHRPEREASDAYATM